jgi:hypothetical protein
MMNLVLLFTDSYSYRQSLWLLGRGISPPLVGSEPTHPNIWAGEDSSCLSPRDHCDGQLRLRCKQITSSSSKWQFQSVKHPLYLLLFKKKAVSWKWSVTESLNDHISPLQEEPTKNVSSNYLHTFPLCDGYKFVTWFSKIQAVHPD